MAKDYDYSELISDCDAHIRAGRIDQAIHSLNRLPAREIGARFRQPLAALCRRTGLIHMGLKILTPENLSDRTHWLSTVSAAEAAEYGTLIQRVGSVREAIDILSALDPQSCPDVYLFLAFCHLSRWESLEAVQFLEHYANSPLTEYKKLVARVNLASALASTDRLPQAMKLLNDLLLETGENVRLKANCLEIAARVAIDQGDYPLAERYLNESALLLKSQGTTDSFLIDKALAIVQARTSNSTDLLDAISKRARERRDWESLRDLDLQRLRISFDQAHFEYLFHGTPFPAYRQKLCASLNVPAPSNTYSLGDGKGPKLHVGDGTLNGVAEFRAGGKVHQTLAALLRDFYRPSTLGDLFAQLYPQEYFDVFSSPERIYQAIRQSRRFLKDRSLPASIAQFEGSYEFQIHGSVEILISSYDTNVNWFEVLWIKLQNSPAKDFSSRELRDYLKLGQSPFWRFTQWAVDAGHLERFGRGAGTRYRRTSKHLAAAA